MNFFLITLCYYFLVTCTNQQKLSPDQNLRRITLANDKIPFYRENDQTSVYIYNKLNSKFSINDLNVPETQTIDNNYDLLEDEDKTGDSMYSLLYSDESTFLVGAKNRLFNLSMKNLFIDNQPKIKWANKCQNGIKCENFIQGSIPVSDMMITCGTNSNRPYCRKYDSNLATFENLNFAKQPLQPNSQQQQHIPPFAYSNSIYYFHSSLQSQDIYKQNFDLNSGLNLNSLIQTPPGAILNPNFRTSYGHKDKVLFFFSESKMLHFQNGLSFKTPQSLVAQICASDDGRSSFSDRTRKFLTFRKAIISCYVPDYEMFHVKYTEIQEATKPVKVSETDITEVFYGIFTIRRSANVFDSALCMYKMETIDETLRGRFKNNPDKTILTQPFDSCDSYTQMNSLQTDQYYRDILKNEKFEMESQVNQKASFALNNVKFTSLAVDVTPSGHVIFLGLNDGKVLKIMNQNILAEYQIFQSGEPITSLLVYPFERLIAIQNRGIKSISLRSHCHKFVNCGQCVNAQDPYCGWSKKESKCVHMSGGHLIQDVDTGDVKKCPISSVFFKFDNLLADQNSDESSLSQNDGQSFMTFFLIFFLIVLTFCVSSILSTSLTWYYLKKQYESHLKDDFEIRLPKKAEIGRLWSQARDRLNRMRHHDDHGLDLEKSTNLKKHQILNCYESSMKPVTLLCSTSQVTNNTTRPNSSSEDTLSTNYSPNTSSGVGGGSKSSGCSYDEDINETNEENGNLLRIINQALSSSSESFSPTTGAIKNNKRYVKMEKNNKEVSSKLLLRKEELTV